MPQPYDIAVLRERLRHDTPLWSEYCAQILDDEKNKVPLRPRPWQRDFDAAMEKQRAAGQPIRALVLKARKLGFCLAPETRVLTADLRWVAIDALAPGDELVATDENVPGGRGRGRKMRRAVIEAKREVREPAFKLTMDNGQTLVATAPHRFLCRRRGGPETEWRTVDKMQVGDYIRHVTEPWEEGGFEDGWFGGMIDGEGHLAGKSGSVDLCVSQRPGAVYDRCRSYLLDRGYSLREEISDRSAHGYEPCCKVCVGRMNELFRLIGTTRPERFVNGDWWEGRELPGKRSGVSVARVTAIEPLGEQRMVDLQTDRKTFIAEGFVSHNSTWVQAKFMQRVTQFPFQYALVAAQDRKTAGVLMDMAALMYENLPSQDELGFSIKPEIVGQGRSRTGSRWMSFGDKLRQTEASIYETLTAGNKGSGRGYTPSMLHGSEVAHWEDPDFLVGLLNAVPKKPETIVVLESTANGFNHFHDRWQRAVEGAEDPETGGLYLPLFYGWQDNPYNALPFVSEQARDRFERTVGDPDGGGDEEEPWLIENFGTTLEQLRWRRVTMADECDGRLEIFHQEHPATPEQAFIGSGNPVFSAILVSKAIKDIEDAPEPVDGVLRGMDWRERTTRAGTVKIPQAAIWVPPGTENADDHDKWGLTHRLRVWEHPVNEVTQAELPEGERKPDGQYIVFADVAQGVGTTSGTDPDYSVIQVIDHVSRMQVARYRSRIAIHDLPLLILLVGLYYNDALIAPEVTGLGIGVVDALAKDYRYSRLYRRRRAGDDRRGDTREQLLGWQTDLRTKPLMEQTFGQALKEGTHGLRDMATGREFTTYVEDDRGRHGAQKGAHDDLCVSWMGAHRVAAELRPREPGQARRRMRGTAFDPLTGY